MKTNNKFLYFFLTIFLIICIFLYKNRDFFLGNDNEYNKLWENRRKKAEQPLKKFNDEIFSKIAFNGSIIDNKYSRTPADDTGGSYWIEIKINKPIARTNLIPVKVPNIYDFTKNPIKIYYKTSGLCTMDDDNIGNKVEKRLGEKFIRIYSKSDTSCPTIYYTTDFDYFWK